jgi:hypothetical protein
MTHQPICTAGLAALSRGLGEVGMIRFMQQFDKPINFPPMTEKGAADQLGFGNAPHRRSFA